MPRPSVSEVVIKTIRRLEEILSVDELRHRGMVAVVYVVVGLVSTYQTAAKVRRNTGDPILLLSVDVI